MSYDNITCVVMGAETVGKSSITLRFTKEEWVQTYDPTVEDSYQKFVSVDKKPCRLDILDTAGQEDYASMRNAYMTQGQAFLLVYAINNRASFTRTTKFFDQVVKVKRGRENLVLALVGNKCDDEKRRQVSIDEGKELAAQFGTPIFYETSAKADVNIKECFDEVVRTYRAAGALPCTCAGACKCNDRCQICTKARNKHAKIEEHEFKEKKKSKWCSIL